MGELVRVWAWSKPGIKNFGDELGPAILLRLGVRPVRVYAPSNADIVTCGSVMSYISGQEKIIWGTGDTKPHKIDASKFDIRAVRGTLTADQVNASPRVPLGDPGILVGRLWGRPWKKRWRCGWVPHYVARKEDEPPGVDKVIDPTGDVDAVIADMGRCATIVSSSLHGLIVAASMRIPTMRISDRRIIGGDYKYLDYLSAMVDPHLGSSQSRLVAAIGDLL